MGTQIEDLLCQKVLKPYMYIYDRINTGYQFREKKGETIPIYLSLEEQDSGSLSSLLSWCKLSHFLSIPNLIVDAMILPYTHFDVGLIELHITTFPCPYNSSASRAISSLREYQEEQIIIWLDSWKLKFFVLKKREKGTPKQCPHLEIKYILS